ncbi:MAG: fluoride efflux transporter CrcB [Catalinimonas sp.]
MWIKECLWVGAGGLVGSVLRYLIGVWVRGRLPGHTFPWGTAVVNVAGCLLIGLLLGWAARRGWATEARLLLMTGFCGGFTTFSSYAAETLNLVRAGRPESALLYAGGSVMLGFAAVAIGLAIARL